MLILPVVCLPPVGDEFHKGDLFISLLLHLWYQLQCLPHRSFLVVFIDYLTEYIQAQLGWLHMPSQVSLCFLECKTKRKHWALVALCGQYYSIRQTPRNIKCYNLGRV